MIRVKALSHTEDFDKKQDLIVQLEKTMEECYDQENLVLYDPAGAIGGDAVTRQAAALSRAQGGHVVLSLPLRRHADIEGVVTLEFLTSETINPKVLESLTISVDLLAPQLYDRYENDHWLFVKAGISARRTTEELLGPKHWIAKLVTIGVILAILVLSNCFNLLAGTPIDMRPMYHVTAPMNFAPVEKRSLCAPFDGQIEEVFKRPGETVRQGEKLFSLKTDDLVKQKSQSDAEALYHKYKAQAYAADSSKIADMQAEEAQQMEAEAKSGLLKSQIERAVIVAPIDGEILEGDLWDKRNTQVKEGEEKMLFASLDKLNAELSVNERDIQDIKKGSVGTLATTSKPLDKVKVTIDRIPPLGQPKEGSNVFTVYATPDKVEPSWRPGMAGEAHIDVEKRTIAWIWTHRLMEFIRLKTWL